MACQYFNEPSDFLDMPLGSILIRRNLSPPYIEFKVERMNGGISEQFKVATAIAGCRCCGKSSKLKTW